MNESDARAYFEAQGSLARELSPTERKEFLLKQKRDPERIKAFGTLKAITAMRRDFLSFHMELIAEEETLKQIGLAAKLRRLTQGLYGVRVQENPYQPGIGSYIPPNVTIARRLDDKRSLDVIFTSVPSFRDSPAQIELFGWLYSGRGEEFYAQRICLTNTSSSGWRMDLESFTEQLHKPDMTLQELIGSFATTTYAKSIAPIVSKPPMMLSLF